VVLTADGQATTPRAVALAPPAGPRVGRGTVDAEEVGTRCKAYEASESLGSSWRHDC
jgi:hypothetical protein